MDGSRHEASCRRAEPCLEMGSIPYNETLSPYELGLSILYHINTVIASKARREDLVLFFRSGVAVQYRTGWSVG
jgi:hypothetical protein